MGKSEGSGVIPIFFNFLNEYQLGSNLCFLSSYIYCTGSEYLNIGKRVRSCGPDKSSKNDSKTQINIQILDLFPSQKVCVWGWGWGGVGVVGDIRKYVPTARSGGTFPPCPLPNVAHG